MTKMTMGDTLNELTLMAANGYNAKKADLLRGEIFNLTYAQGKTFSWKDTDKLCPDQITASAATHYSSVSKTLLLENKEDYDREFSAAIDAEYAGVTYSGSVESSLLYHDTLFQSSSQFYTLNFDIFTALDMRRDGITAGDLTADFTSAVASLPDNIDGDNLRKYFDFFDQFGTHYFATGHLGGTIVMETSVEDSLLNTSSQIDIRAQISLGYESLASNGKLSVEAAYAGSEFLEAHRNQISITLHVIGGLYAAGGKIGKWELSVYDTPAAMLGLPGSTIARPELMCLSNLANLLGAEDKGRCIVNALKEYMLEGELRDGLLGRTQPLEFAQVYDRTQLGGDGFALVTIHAMQEGDRGYVEGKCNAGANPDVWRGLASQHYYPKKNHDVPSASFTIPAPMADSFVVTETITAGHPSISARYVGLGSVDDAVLGEWREISFGAEFTADSDGFVVAWIAAGENGSRGEIRCEQAGGSLLAAASMHDWGGDDIHLPNNSFCVPVRKSGRYNMVLYNGAGRSIAAKAFFVPMSDALRFFKDYEARAPNCVYSAASDGFLIACIGVAADGDRAYVNLCSHPDKALLESRGELASTSMHYFPLSNSYVPFNTAMIPVAKGNWYTARYAVSSGGPRLYLKWMALGRG
ncbi:MAG: hypothetical protein JOZ72_05420 [Alphaproteobacteria bacterium]|nr:hypothetical protein [Alphaproteobacteria bacterium]